jgi:hypothetical protein
MYGETVIGMVVFGVPILNEYIFCDKLNVPPGMRV